MNIIRPPAAELICEQDSRCDNCLQNYITYEDTVAAMLVHDIVTYELVRQIEQALDVMYNRHVGNMCELTAERAYKLRIGSVCASERSRARIIVR